jgi:hypothetical protein
VREQTKTKNLTSWSYSAPIRYTLEAKAFPLLISRDTDPNKGEGAKSDFTKHRMNSFFLSITNKKGKRDTGNKYKRKKTTGSGGARQREWRVARSFQMVFQTSKNERHCFSSRLPAPIVSWHIENTGTVVSGGKGWLNLKH